MIPQQFPMWADDKDGHRYVVLGWAVDASSGAVAPVVAPCAPLDSTVRISEQVNLPRVLKGVDRHGFTYSTVSA